MKSIRFRKTGAAAFLVLMLSACASAPPGTGLQDEGVTEETRTYLVPRGEAAWRTTLSWGSAQGSSLSAFPWEWEQPIGRWSLVWKPLPFEARFSVEEAPERSIGFRVNILGEPYYRSGDFNWSPFTEFEWRERLSPERGIRTVFLLNSEIRRSGEPFNLTAEIRSGPAFQLGKFWVYPHAALRFEAGSPISRYLGLPPPVSDQNWRVPVGLEWRIGIPGFFGLHGGTLGIDATWYGFGYSDFSSVQILSTLGWRFKT